MHSDVLKEFEVLKIKEKKIDGFFVSVCSGILILRLLVQLLCPDNLIFIKEVLSNLIVAGVILMTSTIFMIRKYISNQPFISTPFDLPIGMLFTAAGVSLFYSVDHSLSLNFFVVLISYVLFFYLLSTLLQQKGHLLKFGSYFILCVVVVSIFGLWEFFFLKDPSLVNHARLPGMHYKRIGSVFALPNVLAGFIMLAVPILWAAVMLVKTSLQKRMILLLMVIILFVFFLTFSFLCSVNFILITAVFLPLIVKESLQFKISKKLLGAFWGVFLTFSVLFIFIRANLSILSRKDYLLSAFHLIKENPWWGEGSDTFSIVSTKYVSYVLGYSSYVHNSYLQFWVENGILGFAASVLLVVIFIITARKALKIEQNQERRIVLIAFIWSLSVFFVDNLSNFTMLRPSVSLFGWVLLAGFAASLPAEMKKSSMGRANIGLFGVMTASIVFVVVIVFKIGAGLLFYQQGANYLDQNSLPKAEAAFSKANQIDPLNSQYPAAVGLVNIRRYLITQDKKYLELAEEDFQRSAQLSPHSHRTYLTLCQIAKERGDKDKARKYLAQAAELSPLTYKTSPVMIE